jgi:transposase
MPKSKKLELEKKGFDETVWNKFFHRHQQEYIRKRLRAVKLFAENIEVSAICEQLEINKNSLYLFIRIYLAEGFKGLCRQTTRNHKTRLTTEQELSFKQTIVSKAPFECAFEGNLWTGELMRQFIKREFGIDYKSGIYDLLDRLNLSHQKAHSDYQNADKNEQLQFIEDFKQTLLASDEFNAAITFDEFSISSKPTNYYGWAEKNTRPRVKTDEKKERAPTDF